MKDKWLEFICSLLQLLFWIPFNILLALNWSSLNLTKQIIAVIVGVITGILLIIQFIVNIKNLKRRK